MPKIIHLNCHLFAWTYPVVFDHKLLCNDEARISAICVWMKEQNADIIILSEVWSNRAKDRIEEELRGTFAHFLRFTYAQGCCAGCASCAPCLKLGPEFLIASRAEIHDEQSIPIYCLSGWDRFSKRIIGGFHTQGTFICVSHFDSTSASNRRDNLQKMMRFVHDYSRDRPTVIAGDLNMPELQVDPRSGAPYDLAVIDPEYDTLVAAMHQYGFSDCYRSLLPNIIANRGLTFDNDTNNIARILYPSTTEPRLRIDYFWSRGNVPLSVDVPHVELSDHYPIVMTLDCL